jgi:type IV conjugative transfer system lipoprotein TraV
MSNSLRSKQLYLMTGMLASMLAGCSTGKESFSSEPGPGFGWRSMSENHQRIAAMTENPNIEIKPPVIAAWSDLSLDPSGQDLLAQDPSGQGPAPRVLARPWLDSDVQRTAPQYLRIWIPPFQDPQGNLHEEQAIHTVVQEGQWLIPTRGDLTRENPTSGITTSEILTSELPQDQEEHS